MISTQSKVLFKLFVKDFAMIPDILSVQLAPFQHRKKIEMDLNSQQFLPSVFIASENVCSSCGSLAQKTLSPYDPIFFQIHRWCKKVF